MLGLNPGGVSRIVNDEIMTRWIYKTTDTIDEILGSENYLVYANSGPTKIEAGDYIIIRSQPIDGTFKQIELYVGFNEETEQFFPIYVNAVDIQTGKVAILSGLEDYIEE